MSAGALSSNPVFHAKTKHIETDVHYVRELAMDKKLAVQYLASEYQLADILTKALPAQRFSMLKDKLNVVDLLPNPEHQYTPTG